MFRSYVLSCLDHIGVFRFLEQPRTYGEILAEFGFVDGSYTREVMETLSADPKTLIEKKNGRYQVVKDFQVPGIDEVMRDVDPRIRPFKALAQGMSSNILDRLREEYIDFSTALEREGNDLFHTFNQILGNKIYQSMRAGAFEFIGTRNLDQMRGKRLLDIGCGSGRESADIWLKFDGDIKITGVDPVPSMIAEAEKGFETYLLELSEDPPRITEANRPIFEEASATRLPYDDDSFEAVYWQFILHWTSDPRKAIAEAVRVTKPGGWIFGVQPFKPQANPYFNLVIRSNRNSHGFFWREEYRQWFRENGVDVEIATPAGMFRAQKVMRERQSSIQ
ncbi:MAG: class I SAM-dependent methyltransferase [Anaerolineales bacterium]|nr:class I SAM-dependent methyltransferase [Anaerolineales bacterium]